MEAQRRVPDSPAEICPALVGREVPDSTLRTAKGTAVSLAGEVAKKPTVLVFYRGGW